MLQQTSFTQSSVRSFQGRKQATNNSNQSRQFSCVRHGDSVTVNLGFVEGEEVLHLTFDEAQNQFLPLVDELLSVHTASALGLEEATEFRVTNVVLSRAEAWQLIETMWDI